MEVPSASVLSERALVATSICSAFSRVAHAASDAVFACILTFGCVVSPRCDLILKLCLPIGAFLAESSKCFKDMSELCLFVFDGFDLGLELQEVDSPNRL